MGSWSDLPNDILEQVAKKLHHLELLHFGSVCKPWRFLYLENHHRLHLKGPFLLRSSDFYSNSRKYVCVENEKVQGEIFLSESDTCKWICGSSQGWLVIVDSWGQEIYLLNPFMRQKIKLPSPATFPLFLNDQRRPDDACRDSYEYVYKAIISTDPISNPEDCVIMAIVGELHRLSFCKLGDEKWTNVEGSPSLIDDVTFYQSKFYAVSQFDLTISFDGKNPNDHDKSKVVAQGPLARGNLKRYLVPSGGHLLQVWRTIESLFSCYNNCIDDDDDDDDYDDNDGDGDDGGVGGGDSDDDDDDDDDGSGGDNDDSGDGGGGDDDNSNPTQQRYLKPDRTVKFEVLKLVESKSPSICPSYWVEKEFRGSTHQVKYHWSKLKSLHDQLLFIGFNESFSVPSSTLPNCRSGRIYFSDDHHNNHIDNMHTCNHPTQALHDSGVYDMKNKTFDDYYVNELYSDLMPAVWIVPNYP